jgi:flagellar motor switch protein FliN/FliY
MPKQMHTLDFWLRKITKELPIKEQIPYIPIDIDAIAKTLSEKWKVNLTITRKNTEWKTADKLLDTLSLEIKKMAIFLTPLQDNIYLITNDHITFASKIFQQELSSATLINSFYYFLLLEVLNVTQPFIAHFPLKIAEIEEIKQEDSLCFDLEIKINEHPLFFRLITPISFNRELKKQLPQTFTPIASATEIPINFEIGNVLLSKQSFDTIQIDDFLLLDRITYDLNNKKGRALLKVKQYPLFHVKIKQNKIKILDHAVYNEEGKIMEDNNVIKDDEEHSMEEIPSEVLKEQIAEAVPMSDIQLDVKVELAKCSITMEKLMQLQPGNMLELNITTPDRVYLTVNDQAIATGELLYLGDNLGVKITEILK